jgi:hypothetical protein
MISREVIALISFRAGGARFGAITFEVDDGLVTATGQYLTNSLRELDDGSVAVRKVLRGAPRQFSWPLSVIAEIEEIGEGSPFERVAA